VIVGLLVIGVVVGVLVLRGHGITPGGGGGGGGSSASGGSPIQLSAIAANDPYGTNGEHDAQVGLATDGNQATAWTTEHYNDAPDLGKPGVGLVLDAGQPTTVRQLTISTTTPGFTAVIKGSDSPDSFPNDVSSSQTVDDGTTFTLSGGPYRYYEIWITRLGDGFADAAINEVKAS
jgi:putative peptidoglycan lipid II flippase